MKPLIFNGGETRLDLRVRSVRRPCQNCHGLGHLEDEDLTLFVCQNCRGVGTMELPIPRPIRPKPPVMIDDVDDDSRTRAALDAYQASMKAMSTWRQAVRAAVKAADQFVGPMP